MHDGSGMFGSAFLGEVKIPLNDIDLRDGQNAWYVFQFVLTYSIYIFN